MSSKKPSALNLKSSSPAPLQPTAQLTHNNDRVVATLPTGESVEILLYGATVISWKDAQDSEKLWLSEAAALDGSKAVRGGVPLVFPVRPSLHTLYDSLVTSTDTCQVFGKSTNHPATDSLPQHGFARTSRWEFLGKSTTESENRGSADAGIKLDFGLGPQNLSEEARKAWSHTFGLIYSVTLTRDSLRTNIMVRNEGQEDWEFMVLMHTYLRVDVSLHHHLRCIGKEKRKED